MPTSMSNSTSSIDLSRLKKRIRMVCERLEKGGSLTSSNSSDDRDSSHDCKINHIRNRIHISFQISIAVKHFLSE